MRASASATLLIPSRASYLAWRNGQPCRILAFRAVVPTLTKR